MSKYLDMAGLTYFYNQLKNKFATKSAVGTPLKSSTAAGMTDINKVYVYTGSETGYTAGHWYYYDSGSWHDGGAYNSSAVETDKTLSVSDMPADANVTGGKLTELKSALSEIKIDENVSYTWAQGGLSSATGDATNTNKTLRIRTTNRIPVGDGEEIVFVVPSGFRLYAFKYSSTEGGFIGANGWFGSGTYSFADANYYRFILAYEDDIEITPDAASNVTTKFLSFTDKTLTLENKAADAQTVGNIFDTAMTYYSALPNGTDLNGVLKNGVYRTLGARQYDNMPADIETPATAVLCVFGGDVTFAQLYIDSTGRCYYRISASTTSGWRAWVKISNEYGTVSTKNLLTSSDDLNNISVNGSGIWLYNKSSVPANAPDSTSGGVLVTCKYDDTYSAQLVFDVSTGMYHREGHSGGYSKWRSVSNGKDQLHFIVKKGAWKSNGTIGVTDVKSICCDHIFELTPDSVLNFYLDKNWTYTIREGRSENSLNDRTAYLSNARSHVVKYPYVAIYFNMWENGETVNANVDDFDSSVIIRTSGAAISEGTGDRNSFHDFPESYGQMSVINRAYQMAKINYVTQNDLPLHGGGSMTVTIRDASSGTEIDGVPYSSMRETMASVPQATSFHSFMTMVNNPNSYLYTKHYEQSSPDYYYNSRCYVGAVCSTLIAYCYGIDDVIPTTISFANYPGLNPLPSNQQNPQFLKLGDMLNRADDHIVIVTDIIRTNRGKIKNIEVTEAWKPLCRSVVYTPDEIVDRYFDNDYVAYRYENIDSVTYSPDPWIHLDETETAEPTYSTVLCPRKGDKSNWKLGETVEIDVMDNTAGYTLYVLTNVATESVISTTNIPSGNVISLTGLAEGRYSVYLTDGTNNCTPVYFDVINASATYTSPASHKVKAVFSSTANRTPSAIYWCCNKQSSSDYRAVRSFHVLTAAEIAAGEATVDEPTDYRASDSNNGVWKMRMAFKTEFGLFASDLVDVNVTA